MTMHEMMNMMYLEKTDPPCALSPCIPPLQIPVL